MMNMSSVDGEVGGGWGEGGEGGQGGQGGRGLLAVVDALVVAQAVEAGVDAPADIAHRLPRRPHVDILDVPLEAGERGQGLVAGLAAVFVLRGGCTWRAHNHSLALSPSSLSRVRARFCLHSVRPPP